MMRSHLLAAVGAVFGAAAVATLLFFAVNLGCNRGNAQLAAIVPGNGPLKEPDAPDYVRLTDKTRETGVNFAYDNGRAAGFHTIIESLGGGLGLFDYDNDGHHDLFCPGGGKFDKDKNTSGLPSALFRNLGDWKFVDVTAPSGAGQAPHLTHGCSAADYDGDGFTDVLVTGFGGLQLFHNQGDGTFHEVCQAAGMTDTLWSSSAAWADFNGDQLLDVYICHYVNWGPDDEHDPQCPGPTPEQPREICSPRRFEPLPHILYYSNGDGTFRDVSVDAHLNLTEGKCGKGLGVVVGDVDLDGDLDIYVANDTVDNFLYLNDGEGVFEEVGLFHGVARDANGKAEGSMGTDLGDFDLDGQPDIWVSNFEMESFSLYRNDSNAQFVHVSQGTGITALGQLYVGFGTVFADIDRDGDEDFVVSNGHVINFPKAAPVRQEPLVLINEHGRFSKAVFPPNGYFSSPHRGRGLASSDLDDDGDLDFAFSHNDGEPNALVANETPPVGDWLRVRLIGTKSNRDAIGARIVLHTSAGDQLRLVKGGGSYESQSDLRPFWGVPAGATVTGLSIYWPSGHEQEYSLGEANRSVTIVEPTEESPIDPFAQTSAR